MNNKETIQAVIDRLQERIETDEWHHALDDTELLYELVEQELNISERDKDMIDE